MAVTYTCALCRGSFKSDWSQEEAEREAIDNGFDPKVCSVVCDTCFALLRADEEEIENLA